MKTHCIALSVALALLTTTAFAQSDGQKSTEKPKTPDNPLSGFTKYVFTATKNILLTSADKVPAETYSFRPTDQVRSFGQIVGHVADAQYLFCSIALGEKNPEPKIEQTKTSKADLIAALKDAFAYCDKAYDSMTDASATQMVKLFGGDTPKLGVLTVNNTHNMEHYGNLVVYMRLKNIVPPTSDPGFQAVPKK
ncbi:MAG TPA: DinB family protein [Edaphobacter sp.]